MEYFRKILRFAGPYKKFGYLNIFFNILYALFSSLSFAALIPMLDVLFGKTKQLYQPPIFHGFGQAKDYLMDYMNYRLTLYSGDDKMKA
ncbi:MAG: ABC transporter ATP-binding protein, partial [Bacteroidota bacterium]